jgi:hypothetical protein
MQPGERVRVADTYHWAQGATGTIAPRPFADVESFELLHQHGLSEDALAELVRRSALTQPRVVESLKGPLLFYLVDFDQPQYDSDGDGPYASAEIDASALLPA